jgi:hypothetical protein
MFYEGGESDFRQIPRGAISDGRGIIDPTMNLAGLDLGDSWARLMPLPPGEVVAVPERGLKSRVVSKHGSNDFQLGSIIGKFLRKGLQTVP